MIQCGLEVSLYGSGALVARQRNIRNFLGIIAESSRSWQRFVLILAAKDSSLQIRMKIRFRYIQSKISQKITMTIAPLTIDWNGVPNMA